MYLRMRLIVIFRAYRISDLCSNLISFLLFPLCAVTIFQYRGVILSHFRKRSETSVLHFERRKIVKQAVKNQISYSFKDQRPSSLFDDFEKRVTLEDFSFYFTVPSVLLSLTNVYCQL